MPKDSRLPLIFEIQSEHFGNGRSLSMEGSSVEFHIADLLKEYKAGNLDVEALEQ